MRKILITSAFFVVILAIAAIIMSVRGIGREKIKSFAEVKIGVATFVAEIADTPVKQAVGLSGQEALKENEGMLFIFSAEGGKPAIQHFWMKGMKFPIDIIWISRDKVVGFEKNAPPDNSALPKIYSSLEPVDKVLEVNAGYIEANNIAIGDEVGIDY